MIAAQENETGVNTSIIEQGKLYPGNLRSYSF